MADKNGCTCLDETTRRCPVHHIGAAVRLALSVATARLRLIARRSIPADRGVQVAARMRQDARDALAAIKEALD